MSFIFVLLLLLLVLGLVARLFLVGRGTRRRDDEDVTDTAPAPPAHPDEPIPGSATQRARRGKH